MKISASLYSNKNKSILDSAMELERYDIDYWHIDSIENLEVFEDITTLNSKSEVPIDLHIITKNPEIFHSKINETDIHRVSFQIEELSDKFQFPKFNKTKTGLAITIGNPDLFKTIEKYQFEIDFVLLMMTTPGVSGGRFEKSNFDIIRKLVLKFPKINWCVDGGVNHEISYILKLIGIQSIVVGSYLLNHEHMAQAVLNIRSSHVKSDFLIKDFMIQIENLPLVNASDSILSMLEKMDKHKLGVVFCLDEKGLFSGIISNADIRQVLLTGNFNYDLPISEFINFTPKTLNSDQSTTEMIEFIESIEFPILVLPIIEKNGTLAGAISFHKLLKQE